MSDVSLQDQILCIRRELEMRERAYPKWIKSKRMKQATADRELARMRAVLITLTNLDPKRARGYLMNMVDGKPVRGREI